MYLYGASGHGMVIKEILHASGMKVQAFVDDNTEINSLCSRPVVHDAAGLSPIIVSIGDNSIRKRIVERLSGHTFGNAIHPSAVVSDTAEIGEGTVVMPGAIINAYAKIGKHCVINTGAIVDHECVIGDFVNICPRTTLCGNVHVGNDSQVCAGSVVIQGIHIGSNTTVGAGSVVVKDVPDGVVAYGNPCKVIHENENRPNE